VFTEPLHRNGSGITTHLNYRCVATRYITLCGQTAELSNVKASGTYNISHYVKTNVRITGGKRIGRDIEAVLCSSQSLLSQPRTQYNSIKSGASYFKVKLRLRPQPMLRRASACAVERDRTAI
jgi:hypothetical protein